MAAFVSDAFALLAAVAASDAESLAADALAEAFDSDLPAAVAEFAALVALEEAEEAEEAAAEACSVAVVALEEAAFA